MAYTGQPLIIALDDVKQAALYFDRVLSHMVPHEFMAEREITFGLMREAFELDTSDDVVKKTDWLDSARFRSKAHEKAFYEITFGKTYLSRGRKDQFINDYLNRIFVLEFLTSLLEYDLDKAGKRPRMHPRRAHRILEYVETHGGIEQFRKNANIPAGMPDEKFWQERIDQSYFSPEFITQLYVEDSEYPYAHMISNRNIKPGFRRIYLNVLKGLDIHNPPVLLPPCYSTKLNPASDDVTITLCNLELVDTSKASWEQVLEIRRDVESIRKLRNLRLFIYANYSDKPKSFIEDDLGRRCDDYRQACHDHALQTCLSALSATFSAKNLMASVAAGISAAFFGSPLSGIGTAAAIELAQLSIEVAKGYAAYAKLKRDHEMAYIVDVKKRLEA